MTTAKETADQYNKTRSDLKNKLQPLFDEKNEKRADLRKALDTPEEQGERRNKEKIKRQALNQNFREANKDLIAEYKQSFKDKKEQEKLFVEIFSEAKKLNPELQEKDVRALIM